jgi:flavodoxin I
MATAIFYASSTGNTELISRIIAKELGNIQLIDIADHGVGSINDYDKIILGVPTWGDGELQDDWDEEWDNFKELDFKNKTIALFGLGDQEGYGENYLDAMGIVY